MMKSLIVSLLTFLLACSANTEVKPKKSFGITMNFTIVYNSVASDEIVRLQNAIDDTGSIEGLRVKNGRLKSPDVPPAPTNVTLQVKSKSEIHVSWDPVPNLKPNLTILGYIVFSRRVGVADKWEKMPILANETSVSLSDLMAFSTYTIRVLGFFRFGNGISSEFQDATTHQGTPLEAPKLIVARCSSPSPTEVTLSWDMLDADKWMGFQQDYLIDWYEWDGESRGNPSGWRNGIKRGSYWQSVQPYKSEVTITGLKEYTRYMFYIRARTRAVEDYGEGPEDGHSEKTMEGVPVVPPPNLEWKLTTSQPTDVFVQWDGIPKDKWKGKKLGYRVTYGLSRKGKKSIKFPTLMWTDVDAYSTSLLIKSTMTDKTGKRMFALDEDLIDVEMDVSVAGRTGVGEGVKSKSMFPSTCKCNNVLFAAWFNNAPYVYKNVSGYMAGIFPDILVPMVQSLCSECLGLLKNGGDGKMDVMLEWDRTRDGSTPTRTSEKNLKELVENNVDFHVAMFGRSEIESFQAKYKFVSIVNSPGSAFIVKDKFKMMDKAEVIISSVSRCWPAVVVIILLSMLAGIAIWVLDSDSNNEDFPSENFISGALYHGTYWAFVSMTTVGYGDKTPVSFWAQLLAIVWMLLGPIINGIVIGTLTTSLTTIQMEDDISLYGSNVVAIENSFEYNLGVRRNAQMVNSSQNPYTNEEPYTTEDQLIEAVASGKAEGCLMDSLKAVGRLEQISQNNLKISKIIPERSGFGIILSGISIGLEEEIRSWVESNEDWIASVVKKHSNELEEVIGEKPSSDTGIIDANAPLFKNFLKYSLALLGALVFIGCIFDYGFLRMRNRGATKPAIEEKKELLENELEPIVTRFQVDFEKNVKKKVDEHERELKRFFWQKGYSFGLDGWMKSGTWDEDELKKKIFYSEIMKHSLGIYQDTTVINKTWKKGKNVVTAVQRMRTAMGGMRTAMGGQNPPLVREDSENSVDSIKGVDE